VASVFESRLLDEFAVEVPSSEVSWSGKTVAKDGGIRSGSKETANRK